MIVHQLVVQLKWYLQIMGFNILVGVEQDVMGLFIVTNFLLLMRDVDGNLNSLFHITNCSIELEGPLRFFRHVVSLTH